MELTQNDLNELARLIKGGSTSGRLDGENYCIDWELNTDKWNQDDL